MFWRFILPDLNYLDIAKIGVRSTVCSATKVSGLNLITGIDPAGVGG